MKFSWSIACVLALGLMGCGSDSGTKGGVEEAASSAQAAVTDAARTTSDAVTEAVDGAGAAAKGMVDGAGDAASAALDDAAGAAKAAMDSAQGAVAAAANAAQGAMAAAQADLDLAAGEATYNRYCFSCHAAGVAGAPKLGDKAAWAPRVAKGLDALVASSVSGIPPGMPPMGLCMSCEASDLRNTIAWMIAQ